MKITDYDRWSCPLTQLGICPDCEIAFNIKAGACTKCGAEYGWMSLLAIWKGRELRKLTLDNKPLLDKDSWGAQVSQRQD